MRDEKELRTIHIDVIRGEYFVRLMPSRYSAIIQGDTAKLLTLGELEALVRLKAAQEVK